MISGTLTESELLAAYRFMRKRTDVVSYLSALLVVIFGIFSWWKIDPLIGAIAIGFGVFQFIVVLFMLYFFLPQRARNSYRTREELRLPMTWRWDSQRVTLETPRSHLTREWSDYRKSFENEQFFLLSIGGPFIQIIPKRWFHDESQITEFRSLAFAGRT